MSNGICWLASAGIRSYNSSSFINGSGTRFTITECPETEVATFLVLTADESKIRLIAFATCGASMIAPSTTVSGASDSMPKLTSSYPALVLLSSTDLMELDPISNPTSCLLFFPPNNILQPLYSFALLTSLPTVNRCLNAFFRAPGSSCVPSTGQESSYAVSIDFQV